MNADTQSTPRYVAGWAEMWSWITCGLALFGCSAIARLLWPGGEVSQWLFTLIAVVVWVFGCRLSGLFAKFYDFPDSKYANVKRFFSGAIGYSVFFSFLLLGDGRPHLSRGNLLVAAFVFFFGGLANVGFRRELTPQN